MPDFVDMTVGAVMGGAAAHAETQRDGLYCVYGKCRGFPNGLFGCHPGCSFTMSATPTAVPTPDPIAAAERAVVEAAIRWGTVKNDMDYRNACDVLRSHVITIIRLRAAQGT